MTVDHGTEFASKSLDKWAWNHGVKLDFTRPGKPTENAFIESFNNRLRDECLDSESRPGGAITLSSGHMVHSVV